MSTKIRGETTSSRAPVRFRVARATVTSRIEPTIRENNDGKYKEITLCVKSEDAVTTTRKRPGRPRKLPINPIADATDVIYLSNGKNQGPPKHFPLKGRGGLRGACMRTIPTILNRSRAQGSRKCPVYPSTSTSAFHQYTLLQSTKPLSTTSKQVKQEKKDDWPEDLRDLVNTWDSLPESQNREVVKWFQTPLYPQKTLPQIVRNCHALVSELFSTSSDDGLKEYTEWLETKMAPKEKPRQKLSIDPPPKVVVENQPISLQNCQWSSMKSSE